MSNLDENQQKAPAQHTTAQRLLSEVLGTFAIVFCGCGAVISNAASNGSVGHMGICVTFGAVVTAMIYTLGPISAAHFNPAVTVAFALARRFPWRYAPAYIGAQCAGAILASTLHHFLLGDMARRGGFGATLPHSFLTFGGAFGLEVLLTFFLMLVVMAVATDQRVSGPVPGLAIGLAVVMAALFGGPLTGASMNPVRSLAPALWAGKSALSALPIYLTGPFVGAALAAWIYEVLRDGPQFAQGAPHDLDQALAREPGLSRTKARTKV